MAMAELASLIKSKIENPSIFINANDMFRAIRCEDFVDFCIELNLLQVTELISILLISVLDNTRVPLLFLTHLTLIDFIVPALSGDSAIVEIHCSSSSRDLHISP